MDANEFQLDQGEGILLTQDRETGRWTARLLPDQNRPSLYTDTSPGYSAIDALAGLIGGLADDTEV